MNQLSEKDRIKQLAEIILKSDTESFDVLDYLLKAVILIGIEKPEFEVV